MYLETYSMEELMELIEEKGYCSVEAVEILKEMEPVSYTHLGGQTFWTMVG